MNLTVGSQYSLLNTILAKNQLNKVSEHDDIRICTEYEMIRELTTFSIFTTYPRISWSAAKLYQLGLGNLATIKSSQQDSLLYDLADIDVYYASWIGLNDRHQ